MQSLKQKRTTAASISKLVAERNAPQPSLLFIASQYPSEIYTPTQELAIVSPKDSSSETTV